VSSASSALFRFDAVHHDYIDIETGGVFPHITGMLEQTGWVDDTWMTEESSIRGSAVHRLTANYDLGALDVASCVSEWRGYLLSHVKAVSMMVPRPIWLGVEEPLVHPTMRFGGRPDRDAMLYRMRGVLEGKTAAPAKSHQIQTALQAILVSVGAGIPAEALIRLCLYWKHDGKFTLIEHKDRRDFDEAYRVIRACTR
jgi:hypothetical protein